MAETGLSTRRDSARLGLANRRREKKISLEQISEATKIGVRSLEAIESEEFKKLPGGIYNTSYIRQYARATESDESEILTLYYSVMGITPQSTEKTERPNDPPAGLVSRFLRHTSAVLGS